MREHIAHLEKSGVVVGEAPPELPQLAAHIWRTFMELHAFRSAGMSGKEPLTAEGMLAWCQLTGTQLASWEVDAIKQLDICWMTSRG